MVLSEPARRLTLALAESQTKLTATFVVAVVLQTRAPTGNRCGPVAGLLLSSPMTFQVSGVTFNAADAAVETPRPSTAKIPAVPKARHAVRIHEFIDGPLKALIPSLCRLQAVLTATAAPASLRRRLALPHFAAPQAASPGAEKVQINKNTVSTTGRPPRGCRPERSVDRSYRLRRRRHRRITNTVTGDPTGTAGKISPNTQQYPPHG